MPVAISTYCNTSFEWLPSVGFQSTRLEAFFDSCMGIQASYIIKSRQYFHLKFSMQSNGMPKKRNLAYKTQMKVQPRLTRNKKKTELNA